MQILFNGIIQGILFALMGVAFSLVYSTTRVFHVALGGIYVLAPYIIMSTIDNIGVSAGIVVTVFICGCVGLICEEILHWPFTKKNAPTDIHLIGSLGMFLVIGQVIALIWGNDSQVLKIGVDKVYQLTETVRFTQAQCLGGLGGLLLLIMFFAWLHKSNLGLQFRAMADNRLLLALMGRNVRKLRRMVFGISAMIASLSALLSAYDVGFDPNIGLNAVIVGMIATIVGGRGSFFGPVLAGLMLGILRAEVGWFGSARWEEASSFLILALILFYRPQGLIGKKIRLEESA